MVTRVKKEFVRRSLIEMGHDVTQAQIIAIHKLLQFRSGHLSSSKTANAYDVSMSDNYDGKLTLKHPIYERFLDMKRLKTRSGKVRRGSFPIHNRIVWGHMNELIYKLKYGFVKDVINEIKTDLEIN